MNRNHVKQVIEKWVDSPPWTKEVQEKIISEICEPNHISGQGEGEILKFAEWFADHIEGRYSETAWCDLHGRDFTVAEMYQSFKERPNEEPRLTYPFQTKTPSPSREAELEKCLGEIVDAYESLRSPIIEITKAKELLK